MDEETRRKVAKKRLGTLLFVLLNVAVIGVTAYIDFGENQGRHPAPGHISPLMFMGVVGCFVATLAAETGKYYIMLKHSTGVKNVKMAFRVTALGKYYDNITPLGAGGQPFQAMYLIRNNVPTGTATAIPVVGFFSTQAAFILLALAVFIFGGAVMKLVTMKVAAVVGFLFYIFVPSTIVLFLVFPKAAEKILRFLVRLLAKIHLVKHPEETEKKAIHTLTSAKESFLSICHGRHITIWLMVLSLVYQVAMCSMPYFVLHAFGNDLPYLQVFCTTVFVYLCITFVPTPGNSGMAEGSFYALFSVLGQGNLFWAMLVWRFFCYYLFIGTGLGVTMLEALRRRREVRDDEAAS